MKNTPLWAVTGALTVALAAFSLPAQAQSANATQVRNWAAACSTCHGTHGVAQQGNENLAGVNRDELVKKLMDFKTGRKPATLMHQISKGYSDEQLQQIAGYFANLKK